MTTPEGTPAGWYEDPTKAGELRYHDGTQWTEHITIDGVQTTAPLETRDAIPDAIPDDTPDDTPHDTAAPAGFMMRRMAQSRADDEKSLNVTGPTGVLGRFVPLLDGVPSYRFDDATGDVVLSVLKPSLKNAVEVVDAAGSPVGTISQVGRLRSRYDVIRPDRKPAASVKLASGETDAWEIHIDGVPGATISRTKWSPAGPINLAGVDYAVSIAVALDDQLQRLLLAVPLAIDILDTEVL
ncbi:MAG: hypothetical protein QOC92_864 [Acidimicrobiaceae bacterium]